MIAVIDYGMGNLRSIANALSFLKGQYYIGQDKNTIRSADKLILPGVGAFGAGMKNLRELGMIDVLNEEVLVNRKPILGICLGIQLFAEKSYEDGEHKGLGWIKGEVVKIPTDGNLKVPHMGWNEGVVKKESILLQGLPARSDFYFVHSYYLKCQPEIVTSVCEYGIDLPATIESGNILGTQFHPEKSQDAGLRLLKNFIEMSVNDVKKPFHSMPSAS